MTPYKLSRIRGLRHAGAIPDRALQIAAVVEAVTQGWDLSSFRFTASEGVSESDRVFIGEIIDEWRLDCNVRECMGALLLECRKTVWDNRRHLRIRKAGHGDPWIVWMMGPGGSYGIKAYRAFPDLLAAFQDGEIRRWWAAIWEEPLSEEVITAMDMEE